LVRHGLPQRFHTPVWHDWCTSELAEARSRFSPQRDAVHTPNIDNVGIV
jgi:hypothetical protein